LAKASSIVSTSSITSATSSNGIEALRKWFAWGEANARAALGGGDPRRRSPSIAVDDCRPRRRCSARFSVRDRDFRPMQVPRADRPRSPLSPLAMIRSIDQVWPERGRALRLPTA
jgi:hypothetical protein